VYRRLQRPVGYELDKELAKAYQAAFLYAQRKSQEMISKEMGVSVSTVSRWLGLADREGILQTRVVPPPVVHLQEKLAAILRKETIVSVVPNGPEKNIEALGYAGAQQVMQAILSVGEQDPTKDKITIALSCGTTVTEVVKQIAPTSKR
jgi:DNA-binding transcriptional regulator LsrR (DeoR family)